MFHHQVCHFVVHSTEMYDVELVNILREDQMEQLEQQNIVLNYNVRLAKLPSERLIYETQEVRINQSLAEKIRKVVFDGVPKTTWGKL